MTVYVELDYLVERIQEEGCRLTLTEEEHQSIVPAMNILHKALDRAEKRRKHRQVENEFLNMLKALKNKDREKAFELFKKGCGL